MPVFPVFPVLASLLPTAQLTDFRNRKDEDHFMQWQNIKEQRNESGGNIFV